MLRFLMMSGLLLGLFSAPAAASTIRYEFDVVESYFYLGTVYELDAPSPHAGLARTWEPSDSDYDDVLARVHPVSDLIGQIGRVSLQLSGPWGHSPSVDCISGFMCEGFSRPKSTEIGSTFGLSGFSLYAWDVNEQWGLHLLDPLTGSGRLVFNDDAVGNVFSTQDGTGFFHDPAIASFTLANLTITEIAPVPLPATAPLLALGLLVLGFRARRRAA